MSEAAEIQADTTPAMGVTGWLAKNFANLSAVTVLCGMACWFAYEQNKSSKEDRTMFRDELKAIRTDANDRFNRTEATHTKSMEKMGMTIERAVSGMEKATRALEKTAEKIPGSGVEYP